MSVECCKKCNNKKFGITTLHTDNILESFKICQMLDCKCVQIIYNSHIFKNQSELKDINTYLESNNLNVVYHAPLWINLANPESQYKSVQCLKSICDTLCQCVNSNSVFHIGTNGTIYNVANALNSLNLPHYSKSLLSAEVSAGCGNQIGCTWDDLRKLYEAVDTQFLGLCIDTQHLFGSGMCQFESAESVCKLFENISDIGARLDTVHLNDSAVEFKSSKDRHAGLTYGYIWNSETDSLVQLLNRLNSDKINTVLETRDSQIRDLKKIYTLLD
jgi:endonuclease IV